MKNSFTVKMREFNRFYTDFLGSLNSKVLNSRYSLVSARVLFEINNNPGCNAKDIVSFLNIDKGYLSRILKAFERDKLVSKSRSIDDARNFEIELTAKGKAELEKLEHEVNLRITKLHNILTKEERVKLEKSMNDIKLILTGK